MTINGNMARIDGTDADAIGQQPLKLDFAPANEDGSVRQDDLDSTLQTIFDPEIPVFDPPWSRDMMSEEAQLELGMF